MATERQVEANRMNALRSTGPRTDDGKAACRGNALKHGLAAVELVGPGRADEYGERLGKWGAEVRPATEQARWALGRAVTATFQIERCEQDFEDLAVEHSARASLSWDDDRRVEAGDLASGLARQPTRVVRRLESTRHGAELLVERWLRLGEAADSEEGWGEVEVSAALDLLGVPAELRLGRTPAEPSPGSEPTAFRRELVRRQIERLERRKAEALDPLDDLARSQARAGALLNLTGPGRLLDRYQRDAWRRYHAAIKAAHAPPGPPDEPAYSATIPAAVRPEPMPEPEPEPVREPARFPTTAEEIRQTLEAIRERARTATTEAERLASLEEIEAAEAMFGPDRGGDRPRPVAAGPGRNRRARRSLAARSRRG